MGLKVAVAIAAGVLVIGMIAGGHWLGRLTIDAGAARKGDAEMARNVTTSTAPTGGAVPSPTSPVRLSPPPPRAAAVLPVAAAAAARIGPYGSRRATGTENVALTFDDGPDPRWTPAVLDLLRFYRVSATFCLIGVNVRSFPSLVRQIVSEGHTLCNHSWAHEISLGTWSSEAIRANLERTNAEIRRALPGVAVPYFRHPGGAWTSRAVEVAESLGMASIHWDVDPQDWRRPGAGMIAQVVNGGTRPGSIVLLHDGGGDRSGTVAACRYFLPYLRTRFTLTALPPPPMNGVGRGRYQIPD